MVDRKLNMIQQNYIIEKRILIYIHRSRVDQLEASSAFQPAKLGIDLLQLSTPES